MNAINCSATRSKTFHRGINQGIDLGGIESGIGGIQFKIGFHHQHCLDTVLVYFNGRPDTFDIGVLNRHGVHSLWSPRSIPQLQARPRPPQAFLCSLSDDFRSKYLLVLDEDTGNEVGNVRLGGTAMDSFGGIDIWLFDGKYQTRVQGYDTAVGFVLGVESVLNHSLDPQFAAKAA